MSTDAQKLASKTYYAKNKATIAEKEKADKRWVGYYQANKEVIRKRNLERYYAKQGRTPPPPPAPVPDLAVEDVKTLIKRLQDILPVLVKSEKKKRGKSPPAAPAVIPPVDEALA
jgi:hypothetical protein